MFKRFINYIKKKKTIYITISIILLVISIFGAYTGLGCVGGCPRNYGGIISLLERGLIVFLFLFLIYNIIVLIISKKKSTSRKK